MKRLKFCAVILSLLMITPLISGCWNYQDVDTQFVVMGIVIDKDDEEFVVHAEISKSKGGTEAELVTRVETAKGKTLIEAARNAIIKIGAKLYWGHTMVYIISESVAKEGIADVLSLLSRQTQIRSDIFIAICDDDSVEKVFTFEDPIHEAVSQHLHDLFETYEASGQIRRPPLYMVLQELASSEMSLMLPYITMVEPEIEQPPTPSEDGEDSNEQNQTKEIVITSGSAIFVGQKLEQKLDDTETRSALILKEEITKNFVIAIAEQEKTPACAIEVIGSKLDISPHVTEEDKLVFNITYDIEGDLVELLSEIDYISDENKGILESQFEKTMEKQLADLLQKVQSCKSDICGFGGITHRKLPSFWRSMPTVWDEVYRDSQFNVSVNVDITSSSLSMNPIMVGR